MQKDAEVVQMVFDRSVEYTDSELDSWWNSSRKERKKLYNILDNEADLCCVDDHCFNWGRKGDKLVLVDYGSER